MRTVNEASIQGINAMYKLMTIGFEENKSPNTSLIYNLTLKHFGEKLRWYMLHAAGIRENENPCENWGIESINGNFLIDQNNVKNFDQTDHNEVHEALFVSSYDTFDLPFTAWLKKPFYDQIVFSLRIIEREIYQIFSVDESIFDVFKEFNSIYSIKYLVSSDATNWSETNTPVFDV